MPAPPLGKVDGRGYAHDIYDSVEHRAAMVAREAHAGQVDKNGVAYIEHPARVAARVSLDPIAAAVAWLHDVVEDTSVTLDELAPVFSKEIITAVDALTRREGEEPVDYYARVRANRLALKVKYADIADNTDPARTMQLDRPTRERLAAKYAFALKQLSIGGNPKPQSTDFYYPVSR